ncbi:site-specific integrase [Erythrobacter sp. JK5]|uniref:tyrosine-type recombinase/integrase n=1 Tax=Erythrobacter sp. JK5 TaxID=2829500 RepID=UPI001BAC272E|nr:site-specific integrase [Erythrobacter sp. JK5]QUL38136.1 tyrosine-type recombinase/integrase [Erythrobacter sp. JK5]
MGKLTATAIKGAKEPGWYPDGEGLYLVVGKGGAKSWILRIQKHKRRRDFGLGGLNKVPLKLARERAAEVREQIERGIDPVAERAKAAGIPTFSEAVKKVHAENAPNWKNGKHVAQWITTLEKYACPHFGNRSVADVDAAAVRDCLALIWLEKPETARRLKQRICSVIDWAVAKGYREHSLAMPIIDKGLPKQRAKQKHHPALPYAQMAEFLAHLRQVESMGRLALEMVIFTAARSEEVRAMTWGEIDLEAATWTVPAERTKSGRQHMVPLSPQALALLEKMKPHRREYTDLVFPGQNRGRPLSDMTMAKPIKRMHEASIRKGGIGYLDPVEQRVATPHGFRSTFRDWVSEVSAWPSELGEAALAHVVSDKTVAAYQRGQMLEKRRKLMGDWAEFCEGTSTHAG